MSIIKWKTDRSTAARIERVECLRETEHTVWFVDPFFKRERKHAKECDFHRYHDSWEDAHDYLLKKAKEKVLSALRSLELANSTLGNVKGMKKP